MELCKYCNGTKFVEIFTNRENGNRITGLDNLAKSVYSKTNELMEFYEKEFQKLKHNITESKTDNFVKNESFGYVAKKMLLPENEKIRERESLDYYKYQSEMEHCGRCGEVFENYYQLSKGKTAHRGLIEDLIKNKTISLDLLKLLEMDSSSFCLAGKPRNGKTLFLKYTFNKILNKIKDPKKLFWITEMELFQEFREEKSFNGFMKSLKDYEYIFIDELFASDNWKDANADRDKATITYRNNFLFWDYLSQESKQIYCTTNQIFGLFRPNQSTERIIERIKEICKIIEVE